MTKVALDQCVKKLCPIIEEYGDNIALKDKAEFQEKLNVSESSMNDLYYSCKSFSLIEIDADGWILFTLEMIRLAHINAQERKLGEEKAKIIYDRFVDSPFCCQLAARFGNSIPEARNAANFLRAMGVGNPKVKLTKQSMAWVQAEAYRKTAKYLISLGITNFADIIIEHQGVQSDFETGDSTHQTKSDKSDTKSEKSKEKSKGRPKRWGEFRSIRTDLSALEEKEIADLEGQIELQRAIKKGALSERHKLTKEFSQHMDNISRIIAAAELEIKALQKRQWLIMYTYPHERQV